MQLSNLLSQHHEHCQVPNTLYEAYTQYDNKGSPYFALQLVLGASWPALYEMIRLEEVGHGVCEMLGWLQALPPADRGIQAQDGGKNGDDEPAIAISLYCASLTIRRL